MITTDLSPLQSLPLHTRKEVAVGLGFDVLNKRRDSLEVDESLRTKSITPDDVVLDEGRILKAIHCDTAKDVRDAVELLFDSSVFQRGYSKIRVLRNPFGELIVCNVTRPFLSDLNLKKVLKSIDSRL